MISVILPFHNATPTLEQALRSTLDALRQGDEVIPVDDHSTDDGPRLVRGLAATDARIVPATASGRGLVAALQKGCRRARGAYIARMDADDVCLPGRFEHQRTLLNDNPDLGLVTCRVRYGGDRNTQAGYAAYVDWINRLKTPEDFILNQFVESPLAHPAVLFRRELLGRYGGYRDGPFPEDYDLWLRWLAAGVRFASTGREGLVWNDVPDRLSRNDPRYAVEVFWALKIPFLARWLTAHLGPSPDIIVWGAGKVARKRCPALAERGLRIRAWIDVDPNKQGQIIEDKPVLDPGDLPPPGQCFILSLVGSRGAREKISAWLNGHGYIPGRDYLCCA